MRTIWNTRWVYLLTLGLTLVWGLAAGSIVGWMTEFILGPHGGEADVEHALARLAEVITHNPELGVGVGAGTVATAAIAWLGWTFFGGIVFFAARGDTLPDSARGAVQSAAPLAVQGLVHAVLTAIALALVSVVFTPLPAVFRLLGMLVTVGIAVLARDLVRAQICLHGLDKPYHPRATAQGFVTAVKRPREIAITAGLWAVKMAIAVALVPIAIRALGPSDAGLGLRAVAALGLAVSFARLAWLTHWVPVDLESAPAPDEDGAQTAET